MADRICVRGCIQRGVHYATCLDYGKPADEAECRGCAPVKCQDDSLLCVRCFKRMESLLDDGPDLLGRLRSLADPMKATPTDQHRSGAHSTEPPAPVGADLLDAIVVVELVEPWFFVHLAHYANDLEVVTWLGVNVLDEHPEVEGIREAWSVADAMAKWGPERRTKGEPAWSSDEYSEEVLGGVPEWGDPLLNRDEAEQFVGSARTLQRWRKKGLIEPAGSIYIAGVHTMLYRLSDLTRVRGDMKKKIGRPKAAPAVNDEERTDS